MDLIYFGKKSPSLAISIFLKIGWFGHAYIAYREALNKLQKVKTCSWSPTTVKLAAAAETITQQLAQPFNPSRTVLAKE